MKKQIKIMNIVVLLFIALFISRMNGYAIDWGITTVGDSRAQLLQPSLDNETSEVNIISNNSNGMLDNIIDTNWHYLSQGGSKLYAWRDLLITTPPVWFVNNRHITIISLGGNDMHEYAAGCGTLGQDAAIANMRGCMEAVIRAILDTSDSKVILSDVAPGVFADLNPEQNSYFVSVLPYLNIAYENSYYSFQIIADGGSKPYLWSSDDLPTWLSLDWRTGLLYGTPPAGSAGNYSFTVEIQDCVQQSASRTFNPFTVALSSTTIPTNSTLPSTVEGQSYSTDIVVTGGTPVYVWDITDATTELAGSGLTVLINLNADNSIVRLYGTVATDASLNSPYTFILQVQDSSAPSEYIEKTFSSN